MAALLSRIKASSFSVNCRSDSTPDNSGLSFTGLIAIDAVDTFEFALVTGSTITYSKDASSVWSDPATKVKSFLYEVTVDPVKTGVKSMGWLSPPTSIPLNFPPFTLKILIWVGVYVT